MSASRELLQAASMMWFDDGEEGLRRGAFLWAGPRHDGPGRPVAFGHDADLGGDRFEQYLDLIRGRLTAAGYTCGELVQSDDVWALPLDVPDDVLELDDTSVVGAIVWECWRAVTGRAGV